MSVDNITLALYSLRKNLADYLVSNSWLNCSVYVEGDENLRGKEVVERVADKSKHIGVPFVVIEQSFVRNSKLELGESDGKDYVNLTLTVIALDYKQLLAISNLVRKHMDDLVFDIFNFQDSLLPVVGSANLQDVTMDNISDYNSASVVSRYVELINVVMEIDAQELV